MRPALALLLLQLAACDLPRDAEGTSERLARGPVRIGRVDDGNSYNQEPASHLERALKAHAVVRYGAAEPLLEKLEAGEVDVVMGLFAARSPWEKRVTFAEQDFYGFRVATRNGEHRWAMTVDRAIREARR